MLTFEITNNIFPVTYVVQLTSDVGTFNLQEIDFENGTSQFVTFTATVVGTGSISGESDGAQENPPPQAIIVTPASNKGFFAAAS